MPRARLLVGLTALAAASGLGYWTGADRASSAPRVRVLEAVDGDTILVALPDGRTDTVRLLGIDTPETHHPTKGVECFGPEAAAYTEMRLLGELVELEMDVERRDLYGRRLAHVVIEGHRFADELLRRGFARLLVIDPNRAYARDLLRAELEARRERRGLWASCGDE